MPVEQIILIGLVVLAIMALSTSQLRHAVIYLSIFSLLASFAYLWYQAPDVAIAEAAIGCGLATVLYLVAIKRQRLLTVYFVYEDQQEISDRSLQPAAARLLQAIRSIFAEKDLQTNIVYTTESYQTIIDGKDFDLLLVQDNKQLTIFGRAEDNHFRAVADLLGRQSFADLVIHIEACTGGDSDETANH